MFLLPEIVDEIRNDLSSGMGYNDSRWDSEYFENKIHSARAVLINAYTGKLIDYINDAWVQTLDTSFVTREKDCDFVTFECPSVISFDGISDGFVYVGHVNGVKPFIRIRKGFTNLTMHSVFTKKKDIMWDFKHMEQNKMLLFFYNNPKLEHIMVRGIFNNPTLLPNFNKEVDYYPVDANLKKDIVDMITQDLNRKTSRPVEPNNSNLTEIPR